MNQNPFSNPYCDVVLETLKPGYRMDDVVEGNVHVIVKQPTFIDKIYLKFKGIEHYSIDGIDPTIQVKDCEGRFEERRTFTKLKYEIASLGKQVFPGNYTFPFKMIVDPTRPASMSYRSDDGKDELGKIFYKLKAQITGLPEDLKPSHTILVEMLYPVPLPVVPVQVHKEEAIGKSFWSNDPQNLICTAILDKGAYAVGGNLTLTILADATNCKKDLKVLVNMEKNVFNPKIPWVEPEPEFIQEAEMPIIPAGKKIRHTIMMNIPIKTRPTMAAGVFQKIHYKMNFNIYPSSGNGMNIPIYLIIYDLPKLSAAQKVSLPPSQINEVYEPVVLNQSKLIYPY